MAPEIGFPFWSRAVTVIVATPLSALIDVRSVSTDDCDAETDPGVTVMVGCCATTVSPMVAVTVFCSATVELSVAVAVPFDVVEPGSDTVLADPDTSIVTGAPLIKLPCTSRAVTVIVLVPLSALIVVGLAETDD